MSRAEKKLVLALGWIDRLLTTGEGDNVPRGEAVKMHVRLIARDALAEHAKRASA